MTLVTLRRFVNRHGWEKWIDVQDPPPIHYKLLREHTETRSVGRFQQDFPIVQFARVEETLYELQRWRGSEPVPFEEPVYSEEGFAIDRARFDRNVPSLHRERHYEEALMMIRMLIEENRLSDHVGPLGKAVGTLEQIERAIGDCHLPGPEGR